MIATKQIFNKYFKALYLMLFLIITSSYIEPKINPKATRVVVIDAGHGGKDPGCMHAGSNEKTVTLEVAKKLGKLLTDNMKDVKVVFTRDTDKFIELHERANIANKANADLFISVHVNHSSNTSAYGTETYFMAPYKNDGNLEIAKRENSAILLEDDHEKSYGGFDPNSPEAYIIFSFYQNAFINQSSYMAERVEHHFSKRKTINKSRGVKQAGFLVLWKTAMPSILIETGFLSNTAERKYLISDSGENELAKGIYDSVVDYFKYVDDLK